MGLSPSAPEEEEISVSVPTVRPTRSGRPTADGNHAGACSGARAPAASTVRETPAPDEAAHPGAPGTRDRPRTAARAGGRPVPCPRPAGRTRPWAGDDGMSTVEYAVGTIAAAAFAAILYAVVSGDSVVAALTGLVERALSVTF